MKASRNHQIYLKVSDF